MDQFAETDVVGIDLRERGFSLWTRGPGIWTDEIAPDRHFLDLHIGGALSEMRIVGDNAAAQPCPPNCYSFLPSGRVREVASIRAGVTVRATFSENLLESWAGAAHLKEVRYTFDAPMLGTGTVVRNQLVRYGRDIRIEHAEAMMGTLLLQLTSLLANGHADRTHRPDTIQAALDHIEANLTEPLQYPEISAAVGMSPYQFARLFREYMGTSLRQYVIQRRLARAEELLSWTNDSIADIAYSCGFGSQSHMTTLFRKHRGRTPGEVRKKK